ncbi:hypothetical protein BC829DRAFT_439313 [Chytridium lagenaria]|nr:hypothetical protein BC829DRAFT_439313 [Chytridium lagenaria]
MLAWLYTRRPTIDTTPVSPPADNETLRPPSPDVDNWIILSGDDGVNGTVDTTSDGGTISPQAIDPSSSLFRALISSNDSEADHIHDDVSEVYTVRSDQVHNPSPPASPTLNPSSKIGIKSPFHARSQQYMSRKTRRRILKQLASEQQHRATDMDDATLALLTLQRNHGLAVATTTIGNREIPTLLLLQHAAAKGQAKNSMDTSGGVHPMLEKMRKSEKMRKVASGGVSAALASVNPDWQKRAMAGRPNVMKSARGKGTASSGAFGLM